MRRLRHTIRPWRLGSIVAVCLAYLLAIQGIVASVGLGMAMVPGAGGLIICNAVPAADTEALATGNHSQRPKSPPDCPFCFVAAQSAGFIAVPGDSPALPAYAANHVAAIAGGETGHTIILEFRRTGTEARAPPPFSIV